MRTAKLALGFSLIALATSSLMSPAALAQDQLGGVTAVSSAGPAGDLMWRAVHSDIASSTRYEGMDLVVWLQDTAGDRSTAAVFGRLIDPVTGTASTAPFQISESGTHNSLVGSYNPPTVTYNSIADEFLVAWIDNTDLELWVHRVNASGTPLGTDVRIGTGFTNTETVVPVFSPESNQYLVIWKGQTTSQQVFAQRLAGADASEIGGDIQVSNMTNRANDAVDVAYAPALGRYLVVWRGQTAPIATEYEVYGQFMDLNGSEVGADFRISDAGPDGSATFNVTPPSVEWNPAQREWLVAWSGDDNTGGLVDEEREVFAQRLNENGVEIGQNDFRVSHMGPDGNTSFNSRRPRVSFNPNSGEYMLAWHGDEGSVSSADEQFEIWTQRLSGSGNLVGERTQLTDFLPDAMPGNGSSRPAITYSPRTCNWNVSYDAGDSYPQTGVTPEESEIEIFSRRILSASPCSSIPCPVGTSASVTCSPDTDGSGVKHAGTAAAETFAGTSAGDTMNGGDGDDTFNGGDGDDVINGEAGKDTVNAGNGNDQVKGGAGNDTLMGNDGNDRAYGEAGGDKIMGGKGNDRLFGGKGNDRVYGEAGKDALYGESGNDQLSGGAGKDKLSGGRGKDKLAGGSARDRLNCGAGKDRVKGVRGDRVAADCRP